MEDKQEILPRDLSPACFHWPSFRAGVLAQMPGLMGVIPFGLITGVLCVGVGITPLDSWFMTLFMYSGAAQVAGLDLMARKATAVVIIFTCLVINLRFIMYSASLAPYMLGVPLSRKLLFSYIMSDQSFAFATVEFGKPESIWHRPSYFAGTSLLVWAVWLLAAVCGILLGSALPASLQLEFAVPLTFMGLMVPTFRERTNIAAAIVAACVSVMAHKLPWGLGFVLGAAAGISCGVFLTLRKKSDSAAKGGSK